MLRRILLLSFVALLAACNASSEDNDGGRTAPPADASQLAEDASQLAPDSGTSSGVMGLELMTALAGLWSGPATRTLLGDFRMMNVDFRPADDHVLFGRVDLTEDDSLRFAFSIETHGGSDVLLYRNGGYFLGILRDSRTVLKEYDAAEQRWRFCDVARGCDYIDASFDFSAPDTLIFDVFVNGAQHVYWEARRLETRSTPAVFPIDLASQGTGNAPFPPMPALRTTVSWTAPLAAEADVYVVLPVMPCDLTSPCRTSRSIRATAAAGSRSVSIELEQMHPGDYNASAVLDRNRNLGTTFTPDRGDGVTQPNRPITVAAGPDTSAQLTIVFDIP